MTSRDPVPAEHRNNLDELSVVGFIRSVEELQHVLNHEHIRPVSFGLSCPVPEPARIILPESIQNVVNINPIHASLNLIRDGETRTAHLDVDTLDDNSALTITARSHPAQSSLVMEGRPYSCGNTELGTTFISSVLSGSDNDELHLHPSYYKQEFTPIDPTSPDAFSLLVATASTLEDTDTKRRYALEYKDPLDQIPFQIAYANETHVDGVQVHRLTVVMSRFDEYKLSSQSAEIKAAYVLNADSHLSSFDIDATHTASSLDKEPEAKKLDPQSSLDFIREVIDSYIRDVNSSRVES